MAVHKFEAFRLTDAQTLEAFKKIAAALERDDANVHVRLGEQHGVVEVALATIGTNRTIQELLQSDTSAAYLLQLGLNAISASVQVRRNQTAVNVEVHVPDHTDTVLFARINREAHIHLRGFDSTESTRRLLGNELAEFYARREEALLRLEDLNQKLIEQNEAYRRGVDQEREAFKSTLTEEARTKTSELEAVYAEKDTALSKREQALADRTAALDDRDSRHVRRQIRQDLKSALNSRAQQFTLTKSTTRKRIVVHALFAVLLLGSIILVAHGLWNGPPEGEGSAFWFHTLRVFLGVVGFAASILFYIRWNDHWFRQHADEEFRLKQLELDIDRASWVVEMAMEWRDEKGSAIPEELVERLTRNLFTDREHSEKLQHPYEDLASALFDSVKSMRMAIPGIGEAELDRSALRRFRKAAAAHTE